MEDLCVMINLPAGGVISRWASEASLERTALRIAYLHALTQPEQARECGVHLYSHHLLIMDWYWQNIEALGAAPV